MQVECSKLAAFSQRVLMEYEKSEAYRCLRSQRQRIASLAVLNYLLSRGGEKARRRDISAIFKAGREDRLKSERAAGMVRLSDPELQRILDRLVNTGFLERSEGCKKSKRIKHKKKKETYYGISWSRIEWGDQVTDEDDCDRLNPFTSGVGSAVGNPELNVVMVKKGLLETDPKNVKDEDFWGWLNAVARFVFELEPNDWRIRQWAMKLPASKTYLRAQILNHLDEIS